MILNNSVRVEILHSSVVIINLTTNKPSIVMLFVIIFLNLHGKLLKGMVVVRVSGQYKDTNNVILNEISFIKDSQTNKKKTLLQGLPRLFDTFFFFSVIEDIEIERNTRLL